MSKILFLLSILLFAGFVVFSYLVSQEFYAQFDFDMTVKLQDKISRNWDLPFSILSLIGTLEVTGVIWFILTILLLIRGWVLAGMTMILLPISQALELFGKVFLLHPSPPFMFFRGTLPFNFPSGHVHTDYSYPSGHTIRTAFLVFLLIMFLERRATGILKRFIQISLLFFLTAMLVSRVYLGEHWATDVIGGFLLGASFGIITGLLIPQRENFKIQKIV